MKFKRVIARKGELVHVETPLGIVNIRVGLHDSAGRDVDSIEVLERPYDECRVVRRGRANTRLIRLKERKK